MEDKFGYQQDIKNGDGIIRARTIGGHLRSWEIPRMMSALEVIKKEWGNLEYPGIYILFDSSSKKVYIRPGSPKPKENPKHWQITFRDVFKDSLQKGEGYLLVPRDGILLIPLKEVQKVVTDPSKYKQNTIDVYVNFKEDTIELTYTTNTVDVTPFRLLK